MGPSTVGEGERLALTGIFDGNKQGIYGASMDSIGIVLYFKCINI